MKHRPDNVLYHELIGLEIEVVTHSDPTLVGLRGKIVDETMYTLRVLDKVKGRLRIVPKLYGVFRLRLPDGVVVEVDGSLIVGRPEDRLKRLRYR